MSDRGLHLPLGSVALRMHIFGPADRELGDTLRPPWPRWMRRLYGLEAFDNPQINVAEGEVTVSAALAALRTRLSHRLELLSWICSNLEEMGWEIALSGPDLIAHRVVVPQAAREDLETSRVSAVLAAVSEIDDQGHPRLYEAWQLAPGGDRG